MTRRKPGNLLTKRPEKSLLLAAYNFAILKNTRALRLDRVGRSGADTEGTGKEKSVEEAEIEDFCRSRNVDESPRAKT